MYGLDLISQASNNESYYYLYDGLGSTQALTDSSETVTDTYDHEAFGELLNQSGETENSYLFTGEQYDNELDNYYLRARYYDQGIGRFSQMDEWGGKTCKPITLNKYIYADSDAINGIDPSGYMTIAGQLSIVNASMRLSSVSMPSYASFALKASAATYIVAVGFENTSWSIFEATSAPKIKSANDKVAYEGNRR
nr:RHS repeat-associated core domain-containing protein [Colwellia sp. D2M02]